MPYDLRAAEAARGAHGSQPQVASPCEIHAR